MGAFHQMLLQGTAVDADLARRADPDLPGLVIMDHRVKGETGKSGKSGGVHGIVV